MPERLAFTTGKNTDAVRVYYTDAPGAQPDTPLDEVPVQEGPSVYELGEESQAGRRWAVEPLNTVAGLTGPLSNVAQQAGTPPEDPPEEPEPPAAPALTATVVSSSRIDVAISLPEGAATVEAAFHSGDGAWQALPGSPYTADALVAHTGLTPETTYSYRARARSAADLYSAYATAEAATEAAPNTGPVVALGSLPSGTAEGEPLFIPFTITDDRPVVPSGIAAALAPEEGAAIPAGTVTATGAAWHAAPAAGTYTASVTYTDEGGLTDEASAEITIAAAGSAFYPLDVYPGAVAAYSLRRLTSAYEGPAVRVRRAGTSDETDIGFTEQDTLDTAALEAFAAGGDAEVVRWYSQVASAPDLVVTGAAPLLCQAGATVRERRTGRPRLVGTGAGRFVSAAPAAEAFPQENAPMVLSENLGRDELGSGALVLFGPVDPTKDSPANSDSMIRFSTRAMEIGFRWTGTQAFRARTNREWIWAGGLIGADVKRFMLGPVQEGALTLGFTTGAQKTLRADLTASIALGEMILWPLLTEEEYRERLFAVDRYWKAAISEADYDPEAKIPLFFWWQAKLYNWLKARTVADYTLPTTAQAVDVQAGTVVVEGVDWSYLPPGHTVYAGAETLTLVEAVYDGAQEATTLTLTGDLSRVQVGDQVVFHPYWDGTYASEEEAARLWSIFSKDGDSDRSIGLNGLADPAWYTASTGEPEVTVPVTKVATISEASPQAAAPGTFAVREQAGSRKIAFFEIDLTGLDGPVSVGRVDLSGISLTNEDTNRPYFGMKVYADVAFDPETATWTAPPVDLSVLPPYDDIESMLEGEQTATFYLEHGLNAAREAGAQTALVAVYGANALYGAAATGRQITVANAPVVTLYQAKGLFATDALRVPDVYSGVYNYGMGMSVAFWDHQPIPLASGREGNPFLDGRAMALRGLAVDIFNALMLPPFGGGFYTSSAYIGGYPWSAAETLHYAGKYLDEDVKEAYLAALLHYTERMDEAGQYVANANLGTRQIEACGAIAMHFAPGSEGDIRASEAAKRVLFMDRTGTADTESHTWHKEGNVYEGRTPEGSYNNRSLSHLAGARARTMGRATWAWLDDVLRRGVRFQRHQIAVDANGVGVDSSGWSGRTHDAALGGQWATHAKVLLIALYEEARFWVRRWGTSEDALLLPALASLVSSTRNAISGMNPFAVRRETPPAWAGKSSWASEIPYEPPVEGWYSLLRSLQSTLPEETRVYFQTGSEKENFVQAFPEAPGEEDWLAAKGGTPGTTRFGAFVHTPRMTGAYDGTQGPVLHQFWSEHYGVLLASRRYGPAGSSFPWATPSDWPFERVWGYDDKETPTVFSFAHFRQDMPCEVTFDADGRFIEHKKALDLNATQAKNEIAPDAVWEQTKRFTVLSEGEDGRAGLRMDLRLAYTPGAGGADLIKDLRWSLPLYVSKGGVVETFQVHYWTGETWAMLPYGGVAQAQTLRVTRSVGTGDRQIWIELGSPRKAYLGAGTFMIGPNGNVYRTLEFSLHPTGDGTAQLVPALLQESLTITTTDPGLASTKISSSVIYPQPLDTMPVGGQWGFRTLHDVPEGAAMEALYYEYTTDGEAWHTIASTDPDAVAGGAGAIQSAGENAFEYVSETDDGHDAVPAGLQAVRVRTVNTLGEESAVLVELASAEPVLEVSEAFDAPDGTPLDTSYALGVGGNIYGYNTNAGAAHTIGGKMRAPEGAPNNSWGYQWWVPLSKNNCVVRATLNLGDSAVSVDSSAGFHLAVRSNPNYYEKIRTQISRSSKAYETGTFAIHEQGSTNVTATLGFRPENNTDYVVRMQAIGRVVVSSIYDASGSVLLARVYKMGVSRFAANQRYVSISVRGQHQSWDDFEAYTVY